MLLFDREVISTAFLYQPYWTEGLEKALQDRASVESGDWKLEPLGSYRNYNCIEVIVIEINEVATEII